MRFRNYCISLFLLVWGLLSASVEANEQSKPITFFELKPLICVGKEVGDTCHMQLHISWNSQSPIDLCLYQNEQKLKCWSKSQKVSEKLAISLSKKSEFKLVQSPPHLVLASQVVQINYQINQKYRRRLRAEWSIF